MAAPRDEMFWLIKALKKTAQHWRRFQHLARWRRESAHQGETGESCAGKAATLTCQNPSVSSDVKRQPICPKLRCLHWFCWMKCVPTRVGVHVFLKQTCSRLRHASTWGEMCKSPMQMLAPLPYTDKQTRMQSQCTWRGTHGGSFLERKIAAPPQQDWLVPSHMERTWFWQQALLLSNFTSVL